jgi:hypothetical protein
MIAHWKGIVEEIHFGGSIMPSFMALEKIHLGPQNAKNSKLPKLPENNFEPVRKGGWPDIHLDHTMRDYGY